MLIKKCLVLLGLTCFGLTSCQSISIAPTPTVVVSTNTPQPTNTILPTNTITPTFTPIPPTPTIVPPEVLTKYLENVHIVKTDSFDESSNWGLDREIAIVSNGQLKFVGNGAENWSGASYKTDFQEGEGIVTNFKFTQGELSVIYLDRGVWNTNSYKGFGMYLNQGYVDPYLRSGKEWIGGFDHLRGDLHPKPDVWYSIFIVCDDGGDFLSVIWDPANPEKVIKYRATIGEWKGLNWMFNIHVNKGSVVFDDFAEIEFDSIK